MKTTEQIDDLRQRWQEAREDNTPGAPVDEVLDRLEQKYQTLADTQDTSE
ncbi:hypothetical protein [Pseudomonas sp. 18175]